MTGRQRWEVGEHLVESDYMLLSHYTNAFKQFSFSLICQKLFFFMFFSTSVPYICPKCSRDSFSFFCASFATNVVKQGDIECASLKQENKHCCSLSYIVTKGNVSFLRTEHLHQSK